MFRVEVLGFSESRCRVDGLGFRVWGSRCKVKGLGFGSQGVGLRVWNCKV